MTATSGHRIIPIATGLPINARTAIFPGSFRPFTVGHADIVRRGLEIFDRIIVAVGINMDKYDDYDRECVNAISELYRDEPRVEVGIYTTLTTEFAAAHCATAILRGVRSVKDFEYERDMAEINRQLSGIETVILFSDPRYSAVSSSVVRELQRFGRDVTQFLPKKQ